MVEIETVLLVMKELKDGSDHPMTAVELIQKTAGYFVKEEGMDPGAADKVVNDIFQAGVNKGRILNKLMFVTIEIIMPGEKK